MTSEATGASERHESPDAVGSPVERPVRPAAEARRTLPASLAGRCANGHERGQGVRVHAVPYSDELARNGYAIQRAACGAKPGPRSAGWCYTGMRLVTCPKCLRAEVEVLRTALQGVLDPYHEGQVTVREEASGYVKAAVDAGEEALRA